MVRDDECWYVSTTEIRRALRVVAAASLNLARMGVRIIFIPSDYDCRILECGPDRRRLYLADQFAYLCIAARDAAFVIVEAAIGSRVGCVVRQTMHLVALVGHYVSIGWHRTARKIARKLFKSDDLLSPSRVSLRACEIHESVVLDGIELSRLRGGTPREDCLRPRRRNGLEIALPREPMLGQLVHKALRLDRVIRVVRLLSI